MQDSPRRSLLSRNQRVWIFATVTGVVAIAMLVHQISATISANAKAAAHKKGIAVEKQTLNQETDPLVCLDPPDREAAKDGPRDAIHDNQPQPVADEPAHGAGQISTRPNEPQFSLLPPYVDPGKVAQSKSPEGPKALDQLEPMAAPPAAGRAPEVVVVDPDSSGTQKSLSDKPFGSLDEIDDNAPTKSVAGSPNAPTESQPFAESDNHKTAAAAEPALDAKAETNPFVEPGPALSAPDFHVPAARVEVATPEVPAGGGNSSAADKPILAEPPLEAPKVSTDVMPPQTAVPLPDAATNSPPDVALEQTSNAPPARPGGLDFREELPPKSPVTDDPVPAPATGTVESPALDTVDTSDPLKTEPSPTAVPSSDSENWTPPDPAREKALVNPSLHREKKPLWRLVAPLADNDNANAFVSIDSQRKELNITIIKTTPTKSAVREILSYEIIVRNNSPESVDGLIIEERVPQSLQVADVTPHAAFEKGTLRWLLRAVAAGEQRKLQVNLLAAEGGLAESLTTARALAGVTSNADVQKPQLRVEVKAADEIHNGQICPISYRVTNTGPKPVEHLVLRTILPDQLTHKKGRSLDLVIGRLGSGESHDASLHPRAQIAGSANVKVFVVVAGSNVDETSVNVRVVGSSKLPLCP